MLSHTRSLPSRAAYKEDAHKRHVALRYYYCDYLQLYAQCIAACCMVAR